MPDPNRLTDEDRAWLLANLKRGAMTDDSMAEAIGKSVVALRRWRKANRSVLYVAGYVPDARGRMFVKAWAYGPGKKDAPRPGPAETSAQRMARLRREKRAEAYRLRQVRDLF